MKKNRYIYIVFVFSSMLLASCASNSMREEEKASRMDSVAYEGADKKDMESDFSTDTLNAAQKELFSKRAMQKLEDLYGCLAIISDAKYDTVLRSQALILAKEMFSDTAHITPILESWARTVTGAAEASPASIVISSQPKAVNDSIYAGLISFRLRTNDVRQSIGFVIKKTKKNFGDEQRTLWETGLYVGKDY